MSSELMISKPTNRSIRYIGLVGFARFSGGQISSVRGAGNVAVDQNKVAQFRPRERFGAESLAPLLCHRGCYEDV